MTKDNVITRLQMKLTGDGEVLVRDGDGISSIPMEEISGGTPDKIESSNESSSVTTLDTGIISTEGQLKINESGMIFDNYNESIIFTNVDNHASINSTDRSFSVIIGKNNCTLLTPNQSTQLGQSVTSIGTNTLNSAVRVNRSEVVGAAACGSLVEGTNVSVMGYHALQNVTECYRTAVVGPFNFTYSTSISNSMCTGPFNAPNVNGSTIVISGVTNFQNATSMSQSGGFGVNLGPTMSTATNVWLIGSAVDVPEANMTNYMNFGNTLVSDLNKRRLAVGQLETTSKPKAKLHLANGHPSNYDLNGLTSNPLMIVGDQNEIAPINVSDRSASNSVNGHIIMSSRWNNTTRDAVAIKGSVSVGLANVDAAEFRIVRSDNTNYSTLASVNSGTGNMELHNTDAGIIMKSPDGSKWKLTINNMGIVTTVAI